MTEQPKPDTIRASEADIVLQCGAAATPPEQPIDITGPEAAIGLAAHEAIQRWIDNGMPIDQEPKPQPAANNYGVDPASIADVIKVAPDMLARVREDLSGIKAEVAVLGGGVRGRMDCIAVTDAKDGPYSIAILDWKTGRDPRAGTKPGQRLAYASAAAEAYGMPKTGYIYVAELWLAADSIIESRFDHATIGGFRARLADKISWGVASPGEHCRYCRRRHECEQRELYLRSAAKSISSVEESELANAELLASLWDQSRLLKRALETYERAVDIVIAEQGSLELGDGRSLVHGEKRLDTIDARKAWATMRGAGLDDAEINGCLRVSKTALLERVAAKAPRGQKKTAKEALMECLDNAGAVTHNTSRFRRVVAD